MPMPITRTDFRSTYFISIDALYHLRRGLIALKASFRAAKSRRARYRRTFAKLSGLSNRELNDIGITCANICRIAKEEPIKVQSL